MKTKLSFSLLGFLIPAVIIFSSLFLSNCKGKSEIFDIVDSVENCLPPYIVYFYPEAEHRTRKLEYTWDFGDGQTSHDQKPMHIYNDFGIYTVTLEIRQNEAYDIFSYTLNLTKEATAPFADWDYAIAADSLWAPARVEFQNYSVFSTSFLWEFGDGETSILENPIHIYDNPGTYTTVLNGICQKDTAKATMNMVIKNPPTDLLIHEVTIWMPGSYIGSDVWVSVWYAGFNEDDSGVATGVSSFPVSFPLTLNLFHFTGTFNTDELIFEIWSTFGSGIPEEAFVIKARDLQLDYYPNVISFDNGYGIALEALIEYRD